jgi:sec-independent protein translocase protein TatC
MLKPKLRDEDLFQDSTMTFGEHLDELRGALLKGVVALVVGAAFGLWFGIKFIDVVKAPLQKAITNYYAEMAELQYQELATELQARQLPLPYPSAEIKRLLASRELLFEIKEVDLRQFSLPPIDGAAGAPSPPTADAAPPPEGAPEPMARFAEPKLVPVLFWQSSATDPRTSIKSFGVSETFGTYMKASLIGGVVLASPLILYFLWQFVAAGLYPHEKRYVRIFFPFSVGLFILGVCTAFLFAFEPVLNFLFEFNRMMGIDPDPRISEWMSFVMVLPLGFGIAYQLPLVMLFLERIGIFNVAVYLKNWRISILVIVILSAVLTPADPYSIFILACPLTFLFFGGVLLCHLMPRRARPFEDEVV